MELIQRFYIPEQGILTMPFLSDECSDLITWRNQLGIVSQKEKLFNGTVLDNIALTNNPQDLEKAVQTLQELGLVGFFNQFPQGILTICGEEGRNLSSGQRQLVGLARALVKKPRILVLDEATAAMDWETEHAVLSVIKSYVQSNQASLLLITHQPALAASMDRLMVLEDGQIKGYGTAAELLQTVNQFSKAYHHLLPLN